MDFVNTRRMFGLTSAVQAFEYVKQNHGIDTETSYPYKAKELKCHFSKADIGAEDTGYVDLPEGDEEALKTAVATQGPISVAIGNHFEEITCFLF